MQQDQAFPFSLKQRGRADRADPERSRGEGLSGPERRVRERRRELRRTGELAGLFFENSLTLNAILDRNFNFIRVNRAFAAADGRSPEDFPGRNHFELYPSEARAIFEEVVATGKPFQTFARPFVYAGHPERGVTYWDWTLVPIREDGEEVTLLVYSLREVTEQHRAWEALKLSERRNRDVLEAVDEGFIVVDHGYRISSANRAYCALVKLPEEQVIGRPCHEISHRLPRPCFEAGEDCPVKRAFVSGAAHAASHVHTDSSGQKLQVELKTFPVTNASGLVVSVIESVSDVTERRRLEEQLRQAQKMESIGRLAGGVAHDFNNMLGVILGHTDLALKVADPAGPLFSGLQEIRKAAERSADLTRHLLAFARRQPIAPTVLDIDDAVEGMLTMLRRMIGEGIELAWRPGAGHWLLMMDPSQIDQIVTNLCVNARDAIAGSGRVFIETQAVTCDEASCAGHPEAVPGEYVLLTVSDDGAGMDHDVLAHVFEPFFTTKEAEKGTGLGLATIYGIVRQNNGFVIVYSEPGCGTTFKVYLPRHVCGTVQIAEEGAAAPGAPAHETILLVEDETAILNVTRLMLEKLGYRVLCASTAAEALRVAREYAGRIDLLMSDVVMPEMKGPDLAKQLIPRRPEIRCLFTSGYPENVIAHHGRWSPASASSRSPSPCKTLRRRSETRWNPALPPRALGDRVPGHPPVDCRQGAPWGAPTHW